MLPNKFYFICPIGFRGKYFFRNRPIRNKNCLWQPCLLTNWNEMHILYRGPSIDSSYQISVHLGKRFQRRKLFRNRPIRNKNYLWRPCLLMNRNGMCNLYRGPFIDASTKIRFIWQSGFRGSEEIPFQKSTNQKQELPVAAMFVNRSEPNENF